MNNPLSTLAGKYYAWRNRCAYNEAVRGFPPTTAEITAADWPDSLRDPTAFYFCCLHYFHRTLPSSIREHRAYFSSGGRSFGEDAFHTMWYLLFRECRPASFLEIGVFRGQTTSLAALLARELGFACRVSGVSPFSPAGDSVSNYAGGIDYYSDTRANFDHFGLPPAEFCRAYSTDEQARIFISSQTWDMVYIDGNHEVDVARSDWNLCTAHVRDGGWIILDDSGRSSNYHPPRFATAGHPGPSQLAKEIDRTKFREVLQVGHNRVFQKLPTA